ncbi:hypothetical protein GCM10019059_21920 [Camelimonas fluminis]|nr:hypothetical protein GCM10019059_21920 [Camelimonas fluminis]
MAETVGAASVSGVMRFMAASLPWSVFAARTPLCVEKTRQFTWVEQNLSGMHGFCPCPFAEKLPAASRNGGAT